MLRRVDTPVLLLSPEIEDHIHKRWRTTFGRLQEIVSVTDLEIWPGMLVSLPGQRGVGTVVAVNGDTCKVSLFHSIEESILEEHPTGALSRALVGPQTRVYVAVEGGWLVGRIKDFDAAAHPMIEYVVRFPNGETADLGEGRLRVRIFEPHADPSEVLARGGGESQYLHDRRWAALETAVALRAAAEGLTSALSSKIELVPHQLSAARRVMTDPIPRFLLADEVGMGKTIEAGIIARQCLIDDPTRRVFVLAPPPLVPQWRRELNDRFDLCDFPGQVTVAAHDAWPQGFATPDLLIVDEAHNLLGDAADLARLITLGHAAPRLLLLSATPALGAAQQLLDLLHVLDPAAYGRHDRAKLEARLELGRDLGRILLSLGDDAPTFLVKRSARDIVARLPDDPVVARLAQDLEREEGAGETLADLRQHLADTYRVHQRLIRARRREAMVYFRPRGALVDGRREHVRAEVDENLRWPEILVGLEDWRDTIRLSGSEESGASAEDALALMAAIDAVGCGVAPANLADASGSLRAAQTQEPGERTKSSVAVDIVQALFRRIRRDGPRNPKVVAFGTTAESVDAVHAALTAQKISALRLQAHNDPDAVDATVVAFHESPDATALLCDRSGEEGLNLNFADAILHLDLPFSVTRIEQRIGRLDRFGRSKVRLRQRVLLPIDGDLSPWTAWLEVLAEGFGIFEASTSDAQFVLPELEADLARAFVARGADGLREMIQPVRERLAAARRAADEQYALDAVALGDDGAGLAEQIEDAEINEPGLQAAAEGWLVSALQLRRLNWEPDHVSYAWTRNTLIPQRPWEAEFGLQADRRYTWRRTVAMRRDATLLRPGAPLLDAMERHLRWDDRGSAFTTWRVDPTLPGDDIAWFGFRLCFVVEPALDSGLSVFRDIDVQGLSRRTQALLPPWTHVLHAN